VVGRRIRDSDDKKRDAYAALVAICADLIDAVLERLGLSERPAPDRAGLDTCYLAWCRAVPFDNLVKRIHLVSGSAAPFANADPEWFLRAFVRDGTGGTCWPSSGGLHALLTALGFDARRGSGAMYDHLSGPIHTHGTVIVRVDDVDYWVDSSMLTDVPLPLRRGEATRRDDPVSPVRAEPVGDLWRVWWTGSGDASDIPCLLLDDDVSAEHFDVRYEASRGMSPFNTRVYATRNTPGARITIGGCKRYERTANGITVTELDDRERDRVLVEEFGYSEAIVAKLPVDPH
jgi:N-hydroxyarylamine O-acetyltransferase